MRTIYIYMKCTKAITNNQDIRPSVTIKALLANISWLARWIHMIKLVLKSAYQTIYNNILYSRAISIHRDISYLLKLA